MTTEQNCNQANDGRSLQLPQSAHFLLNDKCNARCVFCGGNYYNSRSGRMMSLEKFKIIAKNIHLEHYRQVVLAGAGDPLLCQDFVPILKYLHATYPSVGITVTTNGIALNREVSEAILECGVTILNISLNAATRETYQRLMQVDAFDKICRQVRDFSTLRRERGKGPYLQLSIPIMHCNVEELPLLIQLAHEVGAVAVNVFYCRFYPREIRNDKNGGFLPDNESLFFHQDLSDRIVRESEQLAEHLGIRLFHEPLFSQGFVPKCCNWTEHELMIGFDGEVFPCGGGELHFKKKLERGEYNFGNALQQTIEEFWNNDSYRAIRVSSKREGRCVIPECGECSNMTSHMKQRGHILEWADFTGSTQPDSTEPVSTLPPLVSVIVPTHNRPDLLKEAIQSILDQTFRNFEIIVINDAGQDAEGVVKGMDSSIVYLRHKQNLGLAAARNTGIRAAKGKYIAYLDDDDIFYPDHLQTLVDFLEGNDYSVAYTDAYRAYQTLQSDSSYVITERDVPYSFDFNKIWMLADNFIPVLCIMHTKECLEVAGYFDESLNALEDWDLWIRISQKFDFRHITKITCEFRWRVDGTSMTSSKELDFIKSHERIYEKYQKIIAILPDVQQYQKKSLLSSKKAAENKISVSCSIVIPTHNQVHHLMKCLDAIYSVTAMHNNFEVIVIDNASTDETPTFLQTSANYYHNLKIIKNVSLMSIAESYNKGIDISRGEFIVLLNTSTVAEPQWLDWLLIHLKSESEIGIVGAKLLSTERTVLQSGIYFMQQGNTIIPSLRLRGIADNDPRINQPEEVHAVTEACLATTKKLLFQLGGIASNHHGDNIGINLCFNALKAGKKTFYEPRSVLILHEE